MKDHKIGITLISSNTLLFSNLIDIEKDHIPEMAFVNKKSGYDFIDIIIVIYDKEGNGIKFRKQRTMGSPSKIQEIVNLLIRKILS
jgi:hypothetical protein